MGRSLRRPRALNNLLLRILSAAVLAPVAIGATLAGTYWFGSLVILIALVSWYEFLHMSRRAGIRAFGLAGGASTVVVVGSTTFGQSAFAIGIIVALLVLAGAAIARPSTIDTLACLAHTVFGVLWIGVPMATAIQLRQTTGAAWLLTAMVVTWVTDTAAYFTGRAIGRHALAPTISPKKTIEGLVGGLLGAILTGEASGLFVLHVPWWLGLVLGIGCGAAAVTGDLLESLVKRQLGAKDSGTLIPGHGGVLDRIDGLLLAIPVASLCVILA